MYFTALEKLRVSESYDKLFYLIYTNNYHKRFSPLVYRYFIEDLNEDEWLSVLNILTKHNLLKINYELCCPFTDETIEIYDRYDQIPLESEVICNNCCEEFSVTTNDIHITYKFEDHFLPDRNQTSECTVLGETNKGSKDIGQEYTLENLKKYPERIYERLINERKEELNTIINKISEATDPTAKGRLFEDLSERLLISPYLKFLYRDRRYSTGEIDLVFEVVRLEGTIFHNFSDMIIVECKNWNVKVGSPEIKLFSKKMDDVKTNIGLFLSKKGITGKDNINDAKGTIKDEWKVDEKIIIVICCKDIINIISNNINLYKFLKEGYYEVKIK
jgi:Holliday junction resolvase-like predicted endonuclease